MRDLFDEKAPWNESTELLLDSIFELPINWIGNKKKLLRSILWFLSENEVKFTSVCDAFAGSGVFSLVMASEGKKVIANDALMLSSTWLLMLLDYHSNPLKHHEAKALAEATGSDGRHNLGFLRKYPYDEVFSADEVDFLEAYRAAVAARFGPEMRCGQTLVPGRTTWRLCKGDAAGDPDKAAFAMQAMCVHMTQKCFVGGRPFKKQVLARLDQRMRTGKDERSSGLNTSSVRYGAIKYLHQHSYPCKPVVETLAGLDTDTTVYNADAVSLLGSGVVKPDLVYFDPPYGDRVSSDYATLYGACEGFLRGQPVEECSDLRSAMKRFRSRREQKRNDYIRNFKELLDACSESPIWLFNFNQSSFASAEEIKSMVMSFGRDVTVKCVRDYCYKLRKASKMLGNEVMILARVR
jgi:adenine-specific DNA methylase